MWCCEGVEPLPCGFVCGLHEPVDGVKLEAGAQADASADTQLAMAFSNSLSMKFFAARKPRSDAVLTTVFGSRKPKPPLILQLRQRHVRPLKVVDRRASNDGGVGLALLCRASCNQVRQSLEEFCKRKAKKDGTDLTKHATL